VIHLSVRGTAGALLLVALLAACTESDGQPAAADAGVVTGCTPCVAPADCDGLTCVVAPGAVSGTCYQACGGQSGVVCSAVGNSIAECTSFADAGFFCVAGPSACP